MDNPLQGTSALIKFLPDGSVYTFQYTTSDESSLKVKLLDDIEKFTKGIQKRYAWSKFAQNNLNIYYSLFKWTKSKKQIFISCFHESS